MTTHDKALDLMGRANDTLSAQLDNGLPKDKEALLDTLREITALHHSARRTAELVAKYGPELVKAALVAGIPQPDLVNLPYHESQVRRLARDAGVGPMRKGRRPVRPVTA